MSVQRRQRFAHARRPVSTAMRVVAAAQAALAPSVQRRSVFSAPRHVRRVAPPARPVMPPRGCEDLH